MAANKPFIRVTWWDAEDFKAAGWATEEEATAFNSEACEVVSYGWLVSQSKHYLTIAADFAAPITYGRMIKIPKKMVKSQETLDLTPPSVV